MSIAMSALDHIRIVLVEPLYAGNVGSVCRVLMNNGLSDLAVVCPPGGIDLEEARKLACKADGMIDRITFFPTLREAVADCTLVAGTSARTGFYRDHAYVPRTLAPQVLESAAAHRVALVFGREDKGLFNDELALCTHIVNIPSSEQYRSLNLSHAVMVCCHELFLLADSPGYEPPDEISPEADSTLRERMFSAWETMMLETGFCGEEKLSHMMLGLRRIFSRGKLTRNDARILMGLARQSCWVAGELKKAQAGEPQNEG